MDNVPAEDTRLYRVFLYLRSGPVIEIESIGRPVVHAARVNPDGGIEPAVLYHTPPEDAARALVMLDMNEVIGITAIRAVEDGG